MRKQSGSPSIKRMLKIRHREVLVQKTFRAQWRRSRRMEVKYLPDPLVTNYSLLTRLTPESGSERSSNKRNIRCRLRKSLRMLAKETCLILRIRETSLQMPTGQNYWRAPSNSRPKFSKMITPTRWSHLFGHRQSVETNHQNPLKRLQSSSNPARSKCSVVRKNKLTSHTR